MHTHISGCTFIRVLLGSQQSIAQGAGVLEPQGFMPVLVFISFAMDLKHLTFSFLICKMVKIMPTLLGCWENCLK